MIAPFLEEFRNSAIPDRLTLANVSWIDGDEAVQMLSEHAIASCQRVQSYKTMAARRIEDRYRFAADGGWFAYGCTVEGDRGQIPYFKSANPRKVLDDGKFKTIRYETPEKCEALPILPFVDDQTAQEVYQRYSVVPLEGETFWQVVQRCNLPIAITEGLKKALALIAHGVPSIALRGISCWNQKGTPNLREEIAQFLAPERVWLIVFDQDSKPKTVQNVGIQIRKLGAALELNGGQVKVVLWDGGEGKGIDDALVKQNNPDQWLSLTLSSTPTLKTWKQDCFKAGLLSVVQQQSNLSIRPERFTSDKYLPELPAIEENKIHILDAGTGAGKTQRIGEDWIKERIDSGWNVLAVSPTNATGQQSAERWGIPHIHDYDLEDSAHREAFRADISYRHGVVLCPDSLARIPEWFWNGDRPVLAVFDEANQVVDHSIHGGTLGSRQSEIVERLTAILEVAGQRGAIILSEDGVKPQTVEWVKRLSKCDQVRLFRHQSEAAKWQVDLFSGRSSAFFASLEMTLSAGKKIMFVTSSQLTGKRLERLIQRDLPDKKIMRIDSETNEGGRFADFWRNPNRYLESKGIPDLLILSPSGKSGVSIDVPGFDSVWGYFSCLTPTDWMQQLARYRLPVPRRVFAVPFVLTQGDESLLYPNAIRQRTKKAQSSYPRVFGLESLIEARESDEDVARLAEIESTCADYYYQSAAMIGVEKAIAYDCLKAKLEVKGHTVEEFALASVDKRISKALEEILEEIWREDAREIATAQVDEVTHSTEWATETLRSPNSNRKNRIIARKVLYQEQFPGVSFDDTEECYQGLTHNFGATRRGVQLQARAQNLSRSKDLDAEEVRSHFEKRLKFSHKLPKNHLRAILLEASGVLPLLNGKPYTEADSRVQSIKKKALHWAKEIGYYFGLQIKPDQSGVHIANKLLQKLGLKPEQLCRTGARGCQQRVWGLPGLWEPTRLKMLDAAAERLQGNKEAICHQPPTEYLEVVAEASRRQRTPDQVPVVPESILAGLGIPIGDPIPTAA